MAGSVRVGSICFSRQLGLEKLLDFRGALTLRSFETRTWFGWHVMSFTTPRCYVFLILILLQHV
jgi:hypothetical protein